MRRYVALALFTLLTVGSFYFKPWRKVEVREAVAVGQAIQKPCPDTPGRSLPDFGSKACSGGYDFSIELPTAGIVLFYDTQLDPQAEYGFGARWRPGFQMEWTASPPQLVHSNGLVVEYQQSGGVYVPKDRRMPEIIMEQSAGSWSGTTAAGSVLTFAWGSSGVYALTKIRNRQNQGSDFVRGGDGRVTSITFTGHSAQVTLEYNINPGLQTSQVRIRDFLNNAYMLTVDTTRRRLLSVKYPDSYAWQIGYHKDNGLVSNYTTDTGEQTHVYYYPGTSIVSRISDAEGKATDFVYGSDFVEIRENNYIHKETFDVSDAQKPLLMASTWAGQNTTYERESGTLKRITRKLDHFGNATNYTYETGTHRVTQAATSTETRTFTYASSVYNLVEVETLSGGGQTKTITTDWQNELPASITESDGVNSYTITYNWNSEGLLLTAVDSLGETIFDASSSGDYSSSGQLLRAKDRFGKTSTWSYDSYGNPLTSVDPTGSKTVFAFNALGFLQSASEPNGRVTSFTRDVLGRETSRTYAQTGRESRTLEQVVSRRSDGSITSSQTTMKVGTTTIADRTHTFNDSYKNTLVKTEGTGAHGAVVLRDEDLGYTTSKIQDSAYPEIPAQ